MSIYAIETPSDLIIDVLSYSGVISDGQSPSAEDMTRILKDMNLYVGQLNRTRFLIYALQDVKFHCTGQKSYTIGVGQEIDTPRPDRIQAANLVFLNGNAPNGNIHIPLNIMQSYEDYSQILLPDLIAPAISLFYDSSFPVGHIYPIPIPPGGNQYDINLIIKTQISQFTSLTQIIELPPEYLNALKWVMINRTRGAYALPPDPNAINQQRTALETVRVANSQQSQMVLPSGVLPIRRGMYGLPGFQYGGLS